MKLYLSGHISTLQQPDNKSVRNGFVKGLLIKSKKSVTIKITFAETVSKM